MPELTPQEQKDFENSESGEVRNGKPLDGPLMEPYAYTAEAQGGWVQFPQDDSPSPKAIGGESIITPRYPEDGGGRGYSITALKGRGSNPYGYADPNNFIDRPGQKPYYDTFSENSDIDARKPTTAAIIRWAQEGAKKKTAGGDGGNKRPYKYTDFVFCKYWNKIPNNYMLTLRRYPYPVFDNLEFPGENGSINGDVTPADYYAPIAQAITYMGPETGNELSNILKFTAKLPYADKESQVHEISYQPPGSDAVPFGRGAEQVAQVLGILGGGADFQSISRNGEPPLDPYNNGPYMNRIYGPINVIKKTKQRQQGLEFEQTFQLKFHYVARPIGNVNTKVIMLELIANMLVLCYAEGAFWGGAHRFTGGRPAYPFLGGPAGADAMYRGDIPGFIDAFTQQLAQAGSNLSDIFNSILDDPIEGLKSLAAGGAKLGLAQQLAKKKIQLAQLPALLTGNPVGEWHLTIGNPLNPIAEIGNLVCTGVQFEFGSELGPDDFPLEMTATVTLEHGMPRDKAAIESMFNRGGGKIYHLPDDYQFGVASWTKNPNAGNTPIDRGSARGVGGIPSNEKREGSSVHRRSILQGDPTVVDKSAKSLADGGSTLYETVKVGFGYYNKPKSQ